LRYGRKTLVETKRHPKKESSDGSRADSDGCLVLGNRDVKKGNLVDETDVGDTAKKNSVFGWSRGSVTL
jgi:hypothetical protein